MSRTDDFDRLYGLLVFLCDEARFLDSGDEHTLTLVFNLVAELHTPRKIVVDQSLSPDDAAREAADLARSLAASADRIDEIVRLRTARSMLRTLQLAWPHSVGDLR